MKVTIRQKFIDKHTKQLYQPGSVVELTEKRVAEIKAKLPNAIEVPEVKAEVPKKEPKKSAPKKAKKTVKAES